MQMHTSATEAPALCACATAKPGMLDIKAKYKWEAWNQLKGARRPHARAVRMVCERVGSHHWFPAPCASAHLGTAVLAAAGTTQAKAKEQYIQELGTLAGK